jgi:hypothetical protein
MSSVQYLSVTYRKASSATYLRRTFNKDGHANRRDSNGEAARYSQLPTKGRNAFSTGRNALIDD